MIITAKVRKYDDGRGFKGFADVILDGAFIVKGITVREGRNGKLFVSMPSKKLSKPAVINGVEKEYEDIFFSITADARNELMNAVLKEFGVDEDNDVF